MKNVGRAKSSCKRMIDGLTRSTYIYISNTIRLGEFYRLVLERRSKRVFNYIIVRGAC